MASGETEENNKKNLGQNSRSLGLKPGLFEYEEIFLNSFKKTPLFSSVVQYMGLQSCIKYAHNYMPQQFIEIELFNVSVMLFNMLMVTLMKSPYSLRPRHQRVIKVKSITIKSNVERETVSHMGNCFMQQDAGLINIVIKFRSVMTMTRCTRSLLHSRLLPTHRSTCIVSAFLTITVTPLKVASRVAIVFVINSRMLISPFIPYKC